MKKAEDFDSLLDFIKRVCDTHGNWKIALTLAGREDAPAELLMYIASNKSYPYDVLIKMSKNRGAPADVLDFIALRNPSPRDYISNRIRELIAKNPSTSIETLTRLSNDENESVQRAAVRQLRGRVS